MQGERSLFHWFNDDVNALQSLIVLLIRHCRIHHSRPFLVPCNEVVGSGHCKHRRGDDDFVDDDGFRSDVLEAQIGFVVSRDQKRGRPIAIYAVIDEEGGGCQSA
jgi:hypothetical protein